MDLYSRCITGLRLALTSFGLTVIELVSGILVRGRLRAELGGSRADEPAERRMPQLASNGNVIPCRPDSRRRARPDARFTAGQISVIRCLGACALRADAAGGYVAGARWRRGSRWESGTVAPL